MCKKDSGVGKMPILVNKDTKVIVQGITGQQGSFHTKTMLLIMKQEDKTTACLMKATST